MSEAVDTFTDILPENSQGHLADNPELLDMWLCKEPNIIDKSSWPYLMLCQDQRDQSFTWHMLCDDYNIPMLIKYGDQALIDDHMSNVRNRPLRGIELLCRADNHRGNSPHSFLTPTSTSSPA